MMKMTLIREYIFKYLYHINTSLYNALDGKDTDLNNHLSAIDLSIQDFEACYGRPDFEHPDNNFSLLNQPDAKQLLINLLENFQTITEILEQKLDRTSLSKVDKIDFCCLLVGANELMLKKTPHRVVIDETVKIAKKYGGLKSPQFINAILDKLVKNSNL